MTRHKSDIIPEHRKEPLEDADHDFDEASEVEGFGKSKVECICPGCAKMHIMKLHWIGRGVPRKFCKNCRDHQTPIDYED